MKTKTAVVMFSGGLDSTTALAWAIARGFRCEAVSVEYGQRHRRELSAARAVCRRLGVRLHEIKLELPWLGVSSLVGRSKRLPDLPPSRIGSGGVPSTYVPGRNLMFASIGVSLADAIGASEVVLGPNVIDYSGYPDCRPAFYGPLRKAVRAGTRAGAEGRGIAISTPFIKLSKADIIRVAARVRAPLELTWSCYAGGRRPCGRCDSCKLRARGFAEAGIPDPALAPGGARGGGRARNA